MTTALSTVPVTYDSVDVQVPDTGIYLEIIKGFNEPPSVRGVDTIIPSAEGRAEGLRVFDTLKIELFGWVRHAASITDLDGQYASFASNRQVVRSLFATDRLRAVLAVIDESGNEYTIDARPVNTIWTQRVRSLWYNVSIELEGYGDWAAAGS